MEEGRPIELKELLFIIAIVFINFLLMLLLTLISDIQTVKVVCGFLAGCLGLLTVLLAFDIIYIARRDK